MVAPRIAIAAGAGLRRLIVLAGAVRSLEQSIIDQSRYLAELDGTVSPEERQQIEAYDEMAARIKTLKPSDPPVASPPFSAPASSFVDLRDYNPPAAAATLDLPMLILQGGRDYQVTMDDFAKWKAALGGPLERHLCRFPARQPPLHRRHRPQLPLGVHGSGRPRLAECDRGDRGMGRAGAVAGGVRS